MVWCDMRGGMGLWCSGVVCGDDSCSDNNHHSHHVGRACLIVRDERLGLVREVALEASAWGELLHVGLDQPVAQQRLG